MHKSWVFSWILIIRFFTSLVLSRRLSKLWDSILQLPKRLSLRICLYFLGSLLYLYPPISRPSSRPPLHRQIITIFEGDGIGPGLQGLIDDSVQFVKIAVCCRSEPHKPRLFCDSECHFVIGGIDVHAHIGRQSDACLGNGNVVLVLVIQPKTLDLLSQLIIHPRNCAAGKGRFIVLKEGPCHWTYIASESLEVCVVT
jgi:hypothetical protein